jgi:anti-sigma-K factor RskA
MTSNEFITSGIIEAYVMGLCTPQEKAEVITMRQQHADVDKAILQFEAALENEYAKAASPTPAALDDSIITTLHQLQPAPVVALQTAPVKKMNWLKPMAAAVMLLLGISTTYNIIQHNKIKQQQTEIAATQQKNTNTLPAADFAVMTNRSITPVAMYGVGIHAICRCTMFWDKQTGKAYIMIHHLATPPQGKSYQMWATVNNKTVSVGIINHTIRNRFIEVSNVPNGAISFSVTLENEGGSTTPTQEETYLVGKI